MSSIPDPAASDPGASDPGASDPAAPDPAAVEPAAVEPTAVEPPLARLRIGRPPEMYVGAVFLTLAALPLVLIGGGLALLVGPLGTTLRQRVTEAAPGVDVDQVVLALRAGGGVLAVVGFVFVGLAWLALRPRRRARTAVTVLAGLEMALLAFAMVLTAPDPVSVGITLLAGAGVALLYLPRSQEFLVAAV